MIGFAAALEIFLLYQNFKKIWTLVFDFQQNEKIE